MISSNHVCVVCFSKHCSQILLVTLWLFLWFYLGIWTMRKDIIGLALQAWILAIILSWLLPKISETLQCKGVEEKDFLFWKYFSGLIAAIVVPCLLKFWYDVWCDVVRRGQEAGRPENASKKHWGISSLLKIVASGCDYLPNILKYYHRHFICL